MIAPWPLTGRSALLEELGRHYRDPARGGVVLHGPAGVGKTRLAEEALRLAERSGRRVERAVGHPTTRADPPGRPRPSPPRRPDDVDRRRRGRAHRAVPRRPGRAAATGRRRPARPARRRPRPAGRHLGRRPHPARRLEDGLPRRHGAHRTRPSGQLTVLHRDGHLVRVEIGPLDTDDVGTLLHRALDAPVTEAARAELARLSGGNLQVLAELVRGAREDRVLETVNGAWELHGPLPTTVVLDELVAEHIEGVDPSGLAVLELLAVADRLGLADLEEAHGAGAASRSRPAGSSSSSRAVAAPPSAWPTRCTARCSEPSCRRCACGTCSGTWPSWSPPTGPSGTRMSSRSHCGGSRPASRCQPPTCSRRAGWRWPATTPTSPST